MKRLLIFVVALSLTLLMTGCVLSTSTLSTTQSTTSSSNTDSSSTTTTLPSSSTTTSTITTTTQDTSTGGTVTTITYDRYQTFELYSMNDFHGGAYSDIETLSKIGEFLKYKKESTNHTLIIANGDIFQGTAFSNYYHGRPIIDIFNEIGFDAFVIGNHEFDWGIDEIAKYNDDNLDNGEAEFPFLAANILSTSNDEALDFTEPYTVHNINGVIVGVIGVIGDVINSISASRVEGYYFDNVYETVRQYAYELRTSFGADIVVAAIHEYNASTNSSIAALTGDYRVDAIFNGHTHQNMEDIISRNGAPLPYAQASNNSSSLLAKITLVYDRVNQTITTAYAETLSESDFSSSDPAVNTIINTYSTDPTYVSFINEELAYIPYSDKKLLAKWAASIIRDYVDIDFGFVNSGGFRVLPSGSPFTMGDLVQLYPFDNFIKTSQLTGAQLNNMCYVIESNDVVADDTVSCSNGVFKQNGVSVVSSQLYTVGAVDYIFDKTNYGFLQGLNITQTEYLMRDLLADYLRESKEVNSSIVDNNYYSTISFVSDNPIFNFVCSTYYQDIFKSIV
ncbi:MAG: hypothetical protein CVV56_00620 [Tenericutes bacterium HGW-Tenericutes-1]|nr:MAG: hypothetical protein CVV56_00620 [Tenericutes bacterium HGW-Tenericutes-1]